MLDFGGLISFECAISRKPATDFGQQPASAVRRGYQRSRPHAVLIYMVLAISNSLSSFSPGSLATRAFRLDAMERV